MSKKCKAYSVSKLGLEPADNRKAFYAGWNAALAEQPEQQRPQNCGTGYCSCIECPYEQPESKPWVGLTDEEIEQVCVPLGAAMLSFTEVARAIEAKLKEKNGF